MFCLFLNTGLLAIPVILGAVACGITGCTLLFATRVVSEGDEAGGLIVPGVTLATEREESEAGGLIDPGVTLATEREVVEAGGLIVHGIALATEREESEEAGGLMVPGITAATERGEQTVGLPGEVP